MKQELKICLPLYKIVYSVSYLVILSLIRGVSSKAEIGVALDANIALLAVVFCAETYVMERSGKRWEIFSLFPMKNRKWSVIRRLLIQNGYLCLISFIGYFLFYWQRPANLLDRSAVSLYVMYVAAISVTVIFWSTLSMTIANLCRNQWAGVGIALIGWLTVNSTFGDRLLGKYNIFAFAFRNLNEQGNLDWLWGKALGMILAGVMVGMIPLVLKKRG